MIRVGQPPEHHRSQDVSTHLDTCPTERAIAHVLFSRRPGRASTSRLEYKRNHRPFIRNNVPLCQGEPPGMGKQEANRESTDVVTRPLRADARRNVDAILEAAKRLFAEMGVDVPMRTIAAEAGVGVGTLYRHFPLRSDMIKAIIQREVDACVEYASAAAEQHPPGEALAAWAQKLVDLTATKRGLGTALHSGDAALRSLPEY